MHIRWFVAYQTNAVVGNGLDRSAVLARGTTVRGLR
jgi:hypothetical protein